MVASGSIQRESLLMVIAVLIIAAGAIALGTFQDSLTNAQACASLTGAQGEAIIYNTTNGLCHNSTLSGFRGTTAAANSTANGLSGLVNTSSFFGTIGTVVAVVALLSIVVLGFSRLGQRNA